MRILVVVPPGSYVNYPVTEAGTYIQVLRNAGHECVLKEANLDLLDIFIANHGQEIKDSLGESEYSHHVFIRTLSDIFQDTNHAYILNFLNQQLVLIDDLVSFVAEKKIDAVVYLFQWLRTFYTVLSWLDVVTKRIEKDTGASQFLTGLGLRSLPDRMLRNFCDKSPIRAIVLGDESRLPEGLSQRGIWDGGEGVLDLGSPLPDMQDYRIDDYLNPRIGSRVTNIYFSRGCPGECTFCNERFTYCGYRKRSPETPALHMRELHERYGFEIFRFSDSRLNEDENAFYKMVDFAIQNRTNNMFWVGMIQGNKPITTYQAKKLYHSGCRALWVGVESGDRKTLEVIQKNTHVHHLADLARNLKEAGILMVTLWIAGGPWETDASARATKNLMEHVAENGAAVHVSPFRLYEKSLLGQEVSRVDIKKTRTKENSIFLPYQTARQDLAEEMIAFANSLSEYKEGECFFYDIEGRFLCSEL